ncbi:MAG: hypothetical protein ABUL52_00845 [Solimonas sp.]
MNNQISIQIALQSAEFVLSEISRVNSLSFEERMERIRADSREGFGCLWGHPKFHPLECGRAALAEFENIVAYSLTRQPDLRAKISWREIHGAVTYAFVDRFIAKSQNLSSQTIQAMADAACNHARKKLSNHTLVIPCRLWTQEIPDEIAVGPIRFIRAKKFFESLPETSLKVIQDDLHERVERFAMDSGWTAVVSVQSVDRVTAERRVQMAVDAGICILKLLVGPTRTRRCRRASEWGPSAFHGYFVVGKDGVLEPAATIGGSEDIVWENWKDILTDGDERRWVFEFASSSIDGILNPEACLPLQSRFLDALKWFGEGVSETSPAARLTKYVFAWERLVATSKEADVTRLVSSRSAHLIAYTVGSRGDDLMRELIRLYDVRSRLAHGSQSPWANYELEKFADESEALTVRLLIGSLLHYWNLNQGGGTDSDLSKSFEVLDSSPPPQAEE